MRLNFTSHVLGPIARHRLKDKEVTQTIRSKNATIPRALELRQVKLGDKVEVFLDDTIVGTAQLLSCRSTNSDNLTENDAKRGGFDNLPQLIKALKRAGYRFKPLDEYPLYRLHFKWE